MRYGKKHDITRQATNDNIILRMCVACWLAKTTDTLSESNNVLLFRGNNIYPNASHCYGGTNSASVLEGKFALLKGML